MSDAAIQIVRSIVQTFWSVVLGLTAVERVLVELGVDGEWAKGVAVTVSMAVVIWLAQNLPRIHPILGNLVSGINRPPAYDAG